MGNECATACGETNNEVNLMSLDIGNYSGQSKNGIPHGVGILHFSDGGRYTGDFHKGKMHGKGTFQWSNGDVYKGQWVEGTKEGFGSLIYSNNIRYTGEWKNDLYEGHGELSFPSDPNLKYAPVSYSGSFSRGKYSGKGTMLYSNGSKYIGNWQLSQQSGAGKLYKFGDSLFIGNFRAGKASGSCTIQQLSLEGKIGQQIYSGSCKNGLKLGFGTFTFFNEAGIQEWVYKGQFVNDCMEGKGLLSKGKNEWLFGTFVAGRKEGRFVRFIKQQGYGVVTFECIFEHDRLVQERPTGSDSQIENPFEGGDVTEVEEFFNFGSKA